MDRIVVGVILCLGLVLAAGAAGATDTGDKHLNDSAVTGAADDLPADASVSDRGGVGTAAPEPTQEVTVVGFNWASPQCPSQAVDDLPEYFTGDIGPSDDDFHVDDGSGGAEDPPDGGCVLRTESGEGNPAVIESLPGNQPQDLGYYPERGDTVTFNHYANLISLLFDGADFQFRFGVQDANNYYYVSILADDGPQELVLGSVVDGSDTQLDTTDIGDTLTDETYQSVAIDWGTGDQPDLLEVTFAGSETVSATDTTFDEGGIGFRRAGTQGTVRSYANLVDRVNATVVDPEFQVNITDVQTALDTVDVSAAVTNIGGLAQTETVTLSVDGQQVDDTSVTLDSGYHDSWDSTETTLSFDPSEYSGTVTATVCAEGSDNCANETVDVDPSGLELGSLEFPDTVPADADLPVEYTVSNTGDEPLTADSVDLLVDGTVADADTDVTVQPGETGSGTLTFTDSDDQYGPGDVIEFTVALSNFDSSLDGSVAVEEPSSPTLQLASLETPDAIAPTDDLEVGYVIENVGTATGTESFVDLKVDGTDSEIDDTDEDVTVGPGSTANGTLVFDNVSTFFDDGDTVTFTVSLFNFDDSLNGSTTVSDDVVPDLQLASLDAPKAVLPTENLTVAYTVENVGDTTGTESFVDLLVDGTEYTYADTDTDVTVQPGETESGTLTFSNVSEEFDPGDTMTFSVELFDFEDSLEGSANVSTDAEPDLQVASVDAPESIEPTDALSVAYTLENTGDVDGTESFVDLLVEGTDSLVQDTDENVTVPAGGTTSGTLTFDSVPEFFDDGDTISFAVQLSDFGDSLNGTTEVVDSGTIADIVIESIDAPATIAPTDALSVDYTLVNQGGVAGTESFVDLKINGTDELFDDSDEDVTVPAGGSESGTLTFDNVSAYFGDGDTISFSVELWDFEDIANGSTVVTEDGSGAPDLQLGSVDAPDSVLTSEDLTVEYTIENAGDAPGTESAVELQIDGTSEDTDTDVTVPAGGSESGSLTFEAVGEQYDGGDVIQHTVALADTGDSESGTTTVEEPAEGPDLGLAGVSADSEIAASGDLVVEYTIENTGDQAGTESAVELLAGGTVRDTDTDVTVPAAGSASGTLTFEAVDEAFDPGDTIGYTVALADTGDTADGTTAVLETGEIQFEIRPSAAAVEPGAVQTYELVVEGPDSGVLAYQDVVVNVTDPAAGTIVSFDEQLDEGNNTLSDSEIRDDGASLYLSALTGTSFSDPADEILLSTFDVEATGSDGDTTDIVFGDSADQTVLDFENETPYDVNGFNSSTLDIAVPEPDLQLSSVSAPNQVPVDDDLTVEYTIENVGGATGTESAVELQIDGTSEDTDTDVTVPAGGSESGTLTFDNVGEQYDGGDVIEYSVALADAGDSESGTTVVTGVDPLFDVEITDANSPVQGDDLEVTAAVENVGGGEGTQTVSLDVPGLGSDSTQVTLAPDATAEEALTVGTSVGDAGQYTATVSSANDSTDTTVSVFGDSALTVSILDTTEPVEGNDLTVDVELENIGDESLTQTISLEVPGLGTDSTQVTLEPGSVTQTTLTVATEITDAGEYSLTVSSADDTAEQPVTVYLPSMPGQDPPQDLDGDDTYEDVDGDGQSDVFDVQSLFSNLNSGAVQNHGWAYDFDGDGQVDIFDVQTLFSEL